MKTQENFASDNKTHGIWHGDHFAQDTCCGYSSPEQGVVIGLRRKGNNGAMDLALRVQKDGVDLQVKNDDGSLTIHHCTPESFTELLKGLQSVLKK